MRAAPRAGTPIRWAVFTRMRMRFLRFPRCGRAGREGKSICAGSLPHTRQTRPLPRPEQRPIDRSDWQSSCGIGTPPAASIERRPITLAELARFLDGTARVVSKGQSKLDLGEDDSLLAYALRPYPSGGASYELELYLAVDKCEGLARGFYHYDAGAHALMPIEVRAQALDAILREAALAMDSPAAPQILITIAARFGRVAWKYSSLAYALSLKDTGVLMQTFYMMATAMGLGACAIGTANIDLFSKMTGLEFHIEGPVGQFAIGRGAKPDASDRYGETS